MSTSDWILIALEGLVVIGFIALGVRSGGVGLGLWAAFVLADELFVAYEGGTEATHLRIFTAQLVSLVLIRQFGHSTSGRVYSSS